ncbi:MAG TPA: Fe-S cluster assembly protein SufD [Phenylobacterium sp.]|uniref:Fe-S cluster assembly protein SufD n=1 Tax=Phenylobacterium sp. TaxID=1871053 RepID=UPI002B46E0D2|nr:Fe-S cluster assembly protein SufD [Phenylobacterium sp.]HKR87886.1 Fe-S cluster assembly protein SufD [Phenylobacterium sp.]
MSLASAIAARDAASLPGRRDEDWRWTDLRGLLRTVPEPSAPLAAEAIEPGPFAGLAARSLTIANGRGDAAIEIAADQVVALDVVSQGDGSHAASVAITVAPGVEATLLESYRGEGSYLAHTALSIRLGEGAKLERIVLAVEDAEGVAVSQAEVELSAAAELVQTTLAFGARRQRLETRVRHPGGHAKLRLDGAYLLEGKRHADLTTAVVHAGLYGETDQLTKGVVRDQARGVFQGRIVVAEGADHTEARMGHHALVLSDHAEVDAKPELEIYADDVSCAHGNTVGALDEEALFYMRQRGIPQDEARAMLVEAFVGEVIDRIGHEGARDVARAWAGERLAAR